MSFFKLILFLFQIPESVWDGDLPSTAADAKKTVTWREPPADSSSNNNKSSKDDGDGGGSSSSNNNKRQLDRRQRQRPNMIQVR